MNDLPSRLVEALRLAASDFDDQVTALPDYVHVPDEIALIYEEVSVSASSLFEENLISSEQLNSINHLENVFDMMSDDKTLWTLEALELSSVWKEVRQTARKILELLDVPMKKPKLYWIHFVKDKGNTT